MASRVQGASHLPRPHAPALAKTWQRGSKERVHASAASHPGPHHRARPPPGGVPPAALLRPHPPGHLAGGPSRPGTLAQPPGGKGRRTRGLPREAAPCWAAPPTPLHPFIHPHLFRILLLFLVDQHLLLRQPLLPAPPPALRLGRPAQRLAEFPGLRVGRGLASSAAAELREWPPPPLPFFLGADNHQHGGNQRRQQHQ